MQDKPLLHILMLLALVPQPLLGGDSIRDSLVLVDKGQAVSSIIVSAEATGGELRAARELAKHIEDISGATLSVCQETMRPEEPGNSIEVGNTGRAKRLRLRERMKGSPEDAFLIRSLPNEGVVFLVGKGDLGTLYAAHHLLESQFGMHWYFPDELGRTVQRRETLSVGWIDEEHQPDFPVRWIGGRRADRWAAFNKNNANVADDLGVHVYKTAHTFDLLCPPEKYFSLHPGYFALVEGKRRPSQLCTSNPEVIKIVSDSIIEILSKNKNLGMITLFPNDGLGFCECSGCKFLDETGFPPVEAVNSRWKSLGSDRHCALSRRMATFYIEVAGRVLEHYPDAYIQAGAYSAYLYPPRQLGLEAPPNIFIEMCHDRCHNHPIESKDCDINKRFLEAMRGWKRVFSGITIYEYYRKGAHLDLPFPIIHSMEKDIPLLKRMGVSCLYSQFGGDYYTNGLNYYVASKLLWNSTENVEEVLSGFYKDFYGKSCLLMKEYWENYENAAIEANIHLSCDINELHLIFSEQLLARQKDLLRQAFQLADSDAVRERIRRAQISLHYVTLCMEYIAAGQDLVTTNRDSWVQHKTVGLIRLHAMAKDILTYRNQMEEFNCFGWDSTYIRRFLKPKWIVRKTRGGREDSCVVIEE